MKPKTSYWEKLKDPRWQKKRLLMLERSEWTCEVCGDSENTLNVYHKQYLKGREPWEYEEGQLIVLCEDCHSFQHEEPDLLNYITSFAPLDGPFNRRELAFVIAAILGVDIEIKENYERSLFSLGENLVTQYWENLEKLSSRKKALKNAY